MHLFSATGLAIIGIVLWVVVATVGRGRREWNILQRKRAIADCPSRSPFLVLIHSRHTPRKAAALLNMLYRQAQNPLRVRAYVLEEIDGLAPSRDVRHIYGVHHNTVDDHRSRIYVTTVARARSPSLCQTPSGACCKRRCRRTPRLCGCPPACLTWPPAGTSRSSPRSPSLPPEPC